MARMPAYVAFLRAINLGATRKFPKDRIVAATEAAGGRAVATYINTGNVRRSHGARSVAKVQAALEEAYAAETGFHVPTVVFTTAELAALTERGEALHEEHEPQGKHYVTLYANPPGQAAIAAVDQLGIDVVNCAPHSRLTAYRRQPLLEALLDVPGLV